MKFVLLFFIFVTCSYAEQSIVQVLHEKPQLTALLNKANIQYEKSTSIQPHSQNLHLLCDLSNISENDLPEYFIACLFDQYQVTESTFRKLDKAIAIWDFSGGKNITRLSMIASHFQSIGESVDPEFLPLQIPVLALKGYKQVLKYSNSRATDINQHLPTIYCHTVMKNPKMIIEAGIRDGESTVALYSAATTCNSKLIGIDTDDRCSQVYGRFANSLLSFFPMHDLDWCKDSHLYIGEEKVDVLFLDTTHLYLETLKELTAFMPLLADDAIMIFHDSNWSRNQYPQPTLSGVTLALKERFLDFDENEYRNLFFEKDGIKWHLIQYPNNNGLLILKKCANLNLDKP